MNPEKVFQRYDVRGKYPGEIDGEFAYRLGRSLGVFSREEGYPGKVTVCRDNKKSSGELKDRLVEGLRDGGLDVVDAGVGTTDYLSYCSNRNSTLGVQVTSSHLPLDFNGFKLVYPEGNSLGNSDLEKVEEIFLEREFSENEQRGLEDGGMKEEYIQDIVSFAEEYSNGEKFEVAVDTSGGSTSLFIREILERLGHDVLMYSDDMEDDGIYRDPPHPGDSMEDFRSFIEKEGADIGFAFDLDGDRVRIYHGEWVTGDTLIRAFASLFEGRKVVSADSPEDVCGREDVDVTRVGDPFVLGRMVEENAVFGGEPNGHYAFGEFLPYSSGMAAAALVASLGPEKLLDSVEDVESVKESFRLEDIGSRAKEVIEGLKESYPVVSSTDGIKIEIDGSEALVRESGTENVLRIKSMDTGERKASDVIEEIKNHIRKY